MVELQTFVQTVVAAVENPDNSPLCRPRDKEVRDS
jgi:hypothetical protein